MATYPEKLRDPRWQKVRLDVWARAECRCEECGATNRTMEVHHTYYERGLQPWEYPLNSLLLLCDRCHNQWHELKTKIDKTFSGKSLFDLELAYSLLQGAQAGWHHQDVLIKRSTDPHLVAAIIRGFWPPHEFQKLMIDTAFIWLAQSRSFWLSDLVEHCIPLDDRHYGSMACWHDDVREGR